MRSTNRVCTKCSDHFSGMVDTCLRCRKVERSRRYRANPEVMQRKRELELIRYHAKKPGLTPEQIAERKREWARNHYENAKAARVIVQDERPPGTKRDGFWRCKCGAKLCGNVKRCLACALTKHNEGNKQEKTKEYQTV